MRLLFISHSSELLGAERSLLEIVGFATTHGHDVVVACPGPGPLVDELARLGADVRLVPIHSWLGPRQGIPPLGLVRVHQVLRSIGGIDDLITEVRPDVIVTNTITTPSGAFAARRASVPHVWIVRESFLTNSQLRSAVSKRTIARLVSQLSTRVCCVSQFVADQLVQASGDPNLIPTVVRPSPKGAWTSRAHDPGTPLALLLPGYFSREKGQHLAIIAVWLAKRSGTSVRLTLVGRGSRPYIGLLRALRFMLGLRTDVALLPWQDSLDSLYAQSDATLLTSSGEAYGRVLAEAITRGRPPIAFDRGGVSEVTGPSAGILVSHRSAKCLAEAFVELAEYGEHEWDTLRASCRTRAEELSAAEPQAVTVLRESLRAATPPPLD